VDLKRIRTPSHNLTSTSGQLVATTEPFHLGLALGKVPVRISWSKSQKHRDLSLEWRLRLLRNEADYLEDCKSQQAGISCTFLIVNPRWKASASLASSSSPLIDRMSCVCCSAMTMRFVLSSRNFSISSLHVGVTHLSQFATTFGISTTCAANCS